MRYSRRCIATRDKVSRPVYCSPKAVLQSRTFLLLFGKSNVYSVLTLLRNIKTINALSERLLQRAIRANQRTKKSTSKRVLVRPLRYCLTTLSHHTKHTKALTIDFELVFCSFLFRLEVIYLSIK